MPCCSGCLGLLSILSFATIANIPILNARCKNAPSLLYWDIIRFAMSLVSSSKLLYGRDIPAQKYSQLTSVFDRLELYNLMTTYKRNGGWVFLLCRLYEDIPLFFILHLKLYIMVWEMASAFFE